ncbi:hypothetical protein R6Q57_005690 [Mikania cordata]
MILAEISGDVASHFISGGNSGSGYDQIGSDKVKYCSENNKRLIHFSTCEVYGKTIGSFLPKDSPLRQDPTYYILKEDTTHAYLAQLRSRDGPEGAENGLEFTIVRLFNWIGPRMDFIPGIDGPSEERYDKVEKPTFCGINELKSILQKHPTYNELVDEVETLKETCNNATNAD